MYNCGIETIEKSIYSGRRHCRIAAELPAGHLKSNITVSITGAEKADLLCVRLPFHQNGSCITEGQRAVFRHGSEKGDVARRICINIGTLLHPR